MIHSLYLSTIDLTLSGGWSLTALTWMFYMAGGIAGCQNSMPVARIGRAAFLFHFVMFLCIMQIIVGIRMAGLSAIASKAFLLHHLLYLLTLSMFGYALLKSATARRVDAGMPRSMDFLVVMFPMAIILLIFPRSTNPLPNKKKARFRRGFWGVYACVFSLMISASLSGYIVTTSRSHMDEQATIKVLIDSKIRTVGLEAFAGEIADRATTGGTKARIKGKRLEVEVSASAIEFQDDLAWRASQMRSFCKDPSIRTLVDNGYRVEFRSAADEPALPIIVEEESCRFI